MQAASGRFCATPPALQLSEQHERWTPGFVPVSLLWLFLQDPCPLALQKDSVGSNHSPGSLCNSRKDFFKCSAKNNHYHNGNNSGNNDSSKNHSNSNNNDSNVKSGAPSWKLSFHRAWKPSAD